MEHKEFRIGLEFYCNDRRWRCTDVGTRVIVAICLDEHKDDDSWFNGPPYDVLERVFDEFEQEGCELKPERLSVEKPAGVQKRFYLRSKYARLLYPWARKHAVARSRRITREAARKLLGVESEKLSVWANFRQRALDTAIAEINKKTDLHVEFASLEKVGAKVVALNFTIKTQAVPKRATRSK